MRSFTALTRLSIKPLLFVSIRGALREHARKRTSVRTFAIGYTLVVLTSLMLWAPPSVAAAEATVIFLTSGTSWTVPNDWNNASNTIEVIAGGGGGVAGGATNDGGSGGGGGAYAKVSNLSLTPGGSVTYGVGAGGAAGNSGAAGGDGGNTWFNAADYASCVSPTTCVSADGGNGAATDGTAGSGGTTAGVGSIEFAGGSGGTLSNVGADSSGGGGGAAGPGGPGRNGGNGDPNAGGQEASGGGGGAGGGSSTAGTQGGVDGGAGGNGPNGTGGGAGGTGGGSGAAGFDGGGGGGGDDNGSAGGGAGGAGTEWDATHGAGGGGGGGHNAGGSGALYGGGGGGNETSSGAGTGGQGIIVITYTPVSAPSVATNFASNIGAGSATLNGTILSDGGASVTEHGFAYATSPTLTSGVATTTLGAYGGSGLFAGTIGSLLNDTTYYFRAYATNSGGTGYGAIVSFTTGNVTVTRKMRLFQGYRIKLINGTLKLF